MIAYKGRKVHLDINTMGFYHAMGLHQTWFCLAAHLIDHIGFGDYRWTKLKKIDKAQVESEPYLK